MWGVCVGEGGLRVVGIRRFQSRSHELIILDKLGSKLGQVNWFNGIIKKAYNDVITLYHRKLG